MAKALHISKDGAVYISLGEMKRDLITTGHRLGLAKTLFNQRDDFAKALKAERAMRSIIEAIVEVGHLIDGGTDKLVYKEKGDK